MEIYATFLLVCSFSASDGASINVWVTDDENRLPLMIDSPLSVGSVKAVLHMHKGLRWPVKAKV